MVCAAMRQSFYFIMPKDLEGARFPIFQGGFVPVFFMSRYAEANGFTKIVHLEADAFLITPQACRYVNTLDEGWTALWCDRFRRPESGVQIIAGSGLSLYKEWAMKPVDSFAGKVIEKTLPFTDINRSLKGDRYGEDKISRVPRTADWCMQARPSDLSSYESYFWWMPWFSTVFHEERSRPVNLEIIEAPSRKLMHEGIYYLHWLKAAAQLLMPQMYLEIGTHAGNSIKMIGCDAVCVDPNFIISSNVLMRRRNTHFFQGTSDDFFSDRSLIKRLFPDGVDLAFLDGLHLYEALLKDFINTERNVSSENSMIVMHDCLPLNERMADRLRRTGDETEPQRIRDFWTGDVWKVVAILSKYRPDLKICYLDCPPTGLVVCTGLDSSNGFLQSNYENIVEEFRNVDLATYGIGKLWDPVPLSSQAKSWRARKCLIRPFIFRLIALRPHRRKSVRELCRPPQRISKRCAA